MNRTVVLQPHPATPPKAISGVTCTMIGGSGSWVLIFSVDSRDALSVSEVQPPARTDGLWQTTCFELFLRRDGEEGYLEFNFSPSGEWAAYAFEGYRQGGRDLDIVGPRILMADVLWATFDDWSFGDETRWQAGVSAVIEEIDGTKSWWALAHPSDKPDFHHPDSFVLELP